MPEPKSRLRERILKRHGKQQRKGRGLDPYVPEIDTLHARTVEDKFGLPIRSVLKSYDVADIAEATGVNRTTIWRWKKRLGIDAAN